MLIANTGLGWQRKNQIWISFGMKFRMRTVGEKWGVGILAGACVRQFLIQKFIVSVETVERLSFKRKQKLEGLS